MVIINYISTIKNYYKELDDHKDQLLDTVSHELRLPRKGILGMLEWSIDQTKEQNTRERLVICQTFAKPLMENNIVKTDKSRLKQVLSNPHRQRHKIYRNR
jgi:signal transduction histidine kinase